MKTKYYWVDQDGIVDKEYELEIRGEAGKRKGERLVWVRKIGSDDLPVGKPEKVYYSDLLSVGGV